MKPKYVRLGIWLYANQKKRLKDKAKKEKRTVSEIIRELLERPTK